VIEQTHGSLSEGSSQSHVSYSDALANYRGNTDWWVVFAAFDLPDFQPSPLWIAKRTFLPIETVVEALEGLSTLGYLRKDNGSFFPIKGKDFVKIDVTSRKKEEVLNEHSLIARQILNQLSENALVAVEHRCFASNVEILSELYTDIAMAFDKAYKSSQDSSKKDKIFKMTFTAVDVLNEKGESR
jgi:hypothetical protein